MNRHFSFIGIALVVMLSSIGLIACGGGSELTASSTCSDFMSASSTEQQEIVNELATQYNKPDYTSPLGAPEVPYYCSANPDVTLEQFFQNAEG